MKVRCKIQILVLVLLSATSALGGVVPGRWEKVETLEPGNGMVVTLTSGEKMDCFFQGSDTESIRVVSSDGNERNLPKSAVSKIETLEKHRGPIWTGALIGGVIGMVVGGILESTYGDRSTNIGPALATGGGMGAGIGLAIDAGIAGRKTLYKAK